MLNVGTVQININISPRERGSRGREKEREKGNEEIHEGGGFSCDPYSVMNFPNLHP